jgi:hypothetical protein
MVLFALWISPGAFTEASNLIRRTGSVSMVEVLSFWFIQWLRFTSCGACDQMNAKANNGVISIHRQEVNGDDMEQDSF